MFELYKAGADIQVRELFDSSVRMGRKALEELGIEYGVADEICKYYFDKDRHRVKLMAEVYDPKLESFKTKQCVKLH